MYFQFNALTILIDISGESLLKPQKVFGQEQNLIYPNKKNEIMEMNKKKKS